MTAYTVNFIYSVSGSTYTMCAGVWIRAGLFPIRLIQVEAYGSQDGTSDVVHASVNRIDGVTTFTGASTLTPVPMRAGAEDASCVVRYRTATSSGGSPTYGTAPTVSGGTSRLVNRKPLAANSLNTWAPVTELTAGPGSVLYLKPEYPVATSAAVTPVFYYCSITIDEERVSRST